MALWESVDALSAALAACTKIIVCFESQYETLIEMLQDAPLFAQCKVSWKGYMGCRRLVLPPSCSRSVIRLVRQRRNQSGASLRLIKGLLPFYGGMLVVRILATGT